MHLRYFIPLLLATACWAQPAAGPSRIKINIIAGQDAANNISMRTAVQPAVEVLDDNNAPVPNAEVIFQAPANGAGGSFFGGMQTHTVKTNSKGVAQANGFIPNDNAGKFRILVRAAAGTAVAEAAILQTNGQGSGSTGSKMSSSQKKMWTIIAVGAAAAIGGGVAASRGGSSDAATAAAKKPVSIGAGPITVGGPR